MQTQSSTKTNGHDLSKAAAERLCKCGCCNPFPAASRFSYLPGHMPNRKSSKAAKAGERACSECGRRLRKDNRSGICTACQIGIVPPDQGTAPAVKNSAGVKTSAPLSTPAPAVLPHPRLALLVTEPQLDTYLVKLDCEWTKFIPTLPPALKLEIANCFLEQQRDGSAEAGE
ncbi:MAG TPA: hypothetical protein VJX23_03070 [Candidatus Binataceae bacterium]|nr:hypothetical protein [Candidatus Binataceae bacterium]